MSKSKQKNHLKEKIGMSNEERTKQEIANKKKARTIVEDKWEKNKYLQEYDSDTIKDVIKIRLHMWQLKCNYKRNNADTKCSLCKKSDHVLECEIAKKFTLSKENRKGEWENMTEIYGKNKKNKEIAVINFQDQHKNIKESGKKSKIRKRKEKEKSRKISRRGRQKIGRQKIQKRRTGG